LDGVQTRLKRENLDVMGSMCAKGGSTGLEGGKAGGMGRVERAKKIRCDFRRRAVE
jgi:hypothetical protein